MKSLREVGIRDLDAVSSRALRLAAMGRIQQSQAQKVIVHVDRARSAILEIQEGSADGEAQQDSAAR